MDGRLTDHRNINLSRLNRDIIRGEARGRVIWQPRILCWYADKVYNGGQLPQPLTGMTQAQMYRRLGISNRIYEYTDCIESVMPESIKFTTESLSPLETLRKFETPVGTVTMIYRGNESNPGIFPSKWFVETEEDLRVIIYVIENTTFRFNMKTYDSLQEEWGDIGLPTAIIPRSNIHSLMHDHMGVEAAIFALYDFTDTVEAYFRALSDAHQRYIQVVNQSPIEWVNFGDNVHSKVINLEQFKKYLLPEYQKRNEALHRAGKFTFAHWDGDTGEILPYAHETGLDGIEAITPLPQGDVTLEQIKAGLGDDMYLVDGIAAVLFEDTYSEDALIEQTKRLIDMFPDRLILGISDEMPSRGLLDRVNLVTQIVDEHNAGKG